MMVASRAMALAAIALATLPAIAMAAWGMEGMEAYSATQIYYLPLDHAFHGASPRYATNDYMEWWV